MADKDFVVKNSLVVNSTFVVNSTAIYYGTGMPNAVINATSLTIGNTTVNASLSGSLLQIANSTSTANLDPGSLIIGLAVINTTMIAVGANVDITPSTFEVGNSTVNTVANSTVLRVANSTSGANVTAGGFAIGSSFANTTVVGVGANVILTTTRVTVGDSSVNTFHTNTVITAANSTASANVTAGGFQTGISVVNSTVVAVGANTVLSADRIFLGNTTVNTTINSTSASIFANSTATAFYVHPTTGNVGIGTTTVTNKLNVNGPASISGALTVSGAVSGVTTLSSGNATITGWANASVGFYIGATRIADTTGNYATHLGGDASSLIARRADTTFIGTTSIALNRTSGSQTLTGVSIDGSASSATTASTSTTQAKSTSSTAIATTEYVKSQFGISTASSPTNTSVNWNNYTVPGTATELLYGTGNVNGPGISAYFYPLNFEYGGTLNGTGQITQLAFGYTTNDFYMRYRYNSVWGSWARFLNTDNYNSYSPTLTGGGASGTWGINITGTASNITSYTINQSVGTGNSPTFNTVYAQVFYDSNNSGYYVDPHNISVLGRIQLDANLWNGSSDGYNRLYFAGADSTYIRGGVSGSYYIRMGHSGDATTTILTGSGDFYTKGNVTAYWSDKRLKKNLEKITDWRDILFGLNGYRYEWNDIGKKIFSEGTEGDGIKIGLVAQEVKAVLPQAACVQQLQFESPGVPREDLNVDINDPYLTVREEKLIPVLVEALKAAHERIDRLESLLENRG